MPIAITREVNEDMNHGELTFMDRVGIDLELAQGQHDHYCKMLAALGCEVITLPTAPALADSV
ncbi:MAG: dimethylargininase, partial [Lysobacterales bacterium]